MFAGVNLYHFTGGPCAELVAPGAARAGGDHEITTIIAVGNHSRGPFRASAGPAGAIPPTSASVAIVVDTELVDATDLDALDRATQAFSQLLRSLEPATMQRRTDCGDWTVNDVANHVCGGVEIP
ncbi:maleylpyruvate isomerase N-terminal domain-containing protein [Mycobacterium sp. THU-M104]|uniref:maleylpyruvate isomerase N-terminal domain-containing protein n=1 Tax=Mycobacterium sp. THU-M104 TaxID=3410515 RepID=UPI003B9B7744